MLNNLITFKNLFHLPKFFIGMLILMTLIHSKFLVLTISKNISLPEISSFPYKARTNGSPCPTQTLYSGQNYKTQAQFHQHSPYSFYACRSQKRKKILMT